MLLNIFVLLTLVQGEQTILFGLLQSPGQNLDDSSFASPLPTTKKPSTVQSKVRNFISYFYKIARFSMLVYNIIVMWHKELKWILFICF